jgi:hypothetical protein
MRDGVMVVPLVWSPTKEALGGNCAPAPTAVLPKCAPRATRSPDAGNGQQCNGEQVVSVHAAVHAQVGAWVRAPRGGCGRPCGPPQAAAAWGCTYRVTPRAPSGK